MVKGRLRRVHAVEHSAQLSVHRGALESCSNYPAEIELEIFDGGYQELIDKEEDRLKQAG